MRLTSFIEKRRTTPHRPRVVILQRVLPHYRVSFFEHLKERLNEDGIDLVVVHGQPDVVERSRNDAGALDWAVAVRNRYIKLGQRTLCWQPSLRISRDADLVIVEQASRMLTNYVLLALRRAHGRRLAFWGHGRNLDERQASRWGEWMKRRLARRADWWFAYTEGTKYILASAGVSTGQITVVQNSSDTRLLTAARSGVDQRQVSMTIHELGISDGPVALYLGSLYRSKRLPFLLRAADHIWQALPDFHLVVIGDGPDRALVESAADECHWIHAAGVKTGVDLARYAATADLILNPGLVGLSVLDAFALQLPMVTCDLTYHSPEFEYLENDFNGVVLPTDTTEREYAKAVIKLLAEPDRILRLKDGCIVSARRYSVETMAARFAQGVTAALRDRV